MTTNQLPKSVVEDDGPDNSLHNLNRFMRIVRKQDDYAMVLSLATFIEDTLGRLLLAYFRDCKATRELIDGFNAPLGTLSSRIKASYSFGLTTEDQFKDMEILRKIRNRHAHNWEGISLGESDIKALIGQLSGYTFHQKPLVGGERERLLETMTTVCMELQIFVSRLEDGKTAKAPDIGFRLTTLKPIETPRARHVK